MLHTLYIPTSDHTPRLTLGEKEVVRWIAGILLAFYRCYIRAVRWQLKGGGSVRKAFLWALCWQQEERNTENVSEQVQSQKMQSFPACTHSSYSAFTYEVVFILQETWKQICLLFINPLILSGRLALVQKFVSFHFTQGPPQVKAIPAALIQKSLDVLMKYLLLDICVLLWAQSNLLKAFAKLMSCCKELSRSKVYCCRPEFSVKIFVQQ